ncbi:MAG: molybdenum cofactor biosynthesis protein MoaE [Candidatus Nanopelagicales bacterium]
MGDVVIASVASDALDVTLHLEAVATAESGATASFLGVVRNHDSGDSIATLEYQAHPTAGDVLDQLAVQTAARPGIHRVAVSHRVDALLDIGDVAIVCAVSAAHRAEAFEACSDLVENIKHQLPVWKLQTRTDGSQDWVNCP